MKIVEEATIYGGVRNRIDWVLDPSRISLWAVIEAGLGAGLVFLALEFITGSLGRSTSLGPATFTLRMMLHMDEVPSSSRLVTAAMFMHFSLSLLTTLILGLAIHRRIRHYAVGIGLAYGALLYVGNVLLFLLLRPDLGIITDTLMLIDYALYGAVAAWLYKQRQEALSVAS